MLNTESIDFGITTSELTQHLDDVPTPPPIAINFLLHECSQYLYSVPAWIKQKINQLNVSKSTWYLTIAMLILGVVLLYKQLQSHSKIESVVLNTDTINAPMAISDLFSQIHCVACEDGVRRHAFVPCGHMILCDTCAGQYTKQVCPICCTPGTTVRIRYP